MRLIDADDLLTAFPIGDGPTVTIACIRATIKHMPTIEKRKTGNWVGIDDEPCETFECDVCGFVLGDWIEGAFYNYCPNCGADMRGGNNETNSNLD